MLTMETLRREVAEGAIDTVLACMIDMQGRLMGKRFTARHFIDHAWAETHCCDYLLATDLEMETPSGYAAASWDKGYGDYTMHPDLSTLRPVPWLPGTALVLCDVLDHDGAAPIAHAPRAVLRRQIARAEAMGFAPVAATELEFFLFADSHEDIRASGFRDLQPISGYNEDYHIFQTTKEERILRPLRNHLLAMGIPVEGTKGEAEAGQAELNIRHADALSCADHHSLAKHATKEIAWSEGHAASFMAKWDADRVGSASHIHLSLIRGGKPAFAAEQGLSPVMQQFLAGQLDHAAEIMVFLAPYVNSYKRFAAGTFAPTRALWSRDNRTAGFRVIGDGSPGARIECRIPGADVNPYLALAALLAAGLSGIEGKLALPDESSGNLYDRDTGALPLTLPAATEALRSSDMLRAAMGDAVVDHYTRAAEWEQEQFNRAVTDYEIARGFERS
ncbi:MAG: glutamine synthetase family protein [Pseudomonadota bacterium]